MNNFSKPRNNLLNYEFTNKKTQNKKKFQRIMNLRS